MAIIRALNDIAKSMQGSSPTPAAIRKALEARWTIDYISSIEVKDIEITPTKGGVEMRAAYDGRAPFVANIYFVVEFDKAVVIQTGGGL
jgi:hypothetical protein